LATSSSFGLLDRLVDAGKSVIVIAHHRRSWRRRLIIDLGPAPADGGGSSEPPADLVAASTRTGGTSRPTSALIEAWVGLPAGAARSSS
jgi:hypothetical protein